MRRDICLVAVGLAIVGGRATGQPPSPPSGGFGPVARPSFSPYLNLARQGVSPAVNYYGIVRPLQQQQNAIQGLQQTANFPNPFQAQSTADQILVTGNPYGFQNYRLYFQNQFSAGGFSPAPGGQLPTSRGAGAVTGGQLGVVPAPRRR